MNVDPAALAAEVRRARRAAAPPRSALRAPAALPADAEQAAVLADLDDAADALEHGLSATVAAWSRGDADPAPRGRSVTRLEAADALLDVMLREREAASPSVGSHTSS